MMALEVLILAKFMSAENLSNFWGKSCETDLFRQWLALLDLQL